MTRRLSLAVGAIASFLALSIGLFLGIQSTRSTRATVAENLEVSVRSLAMQLPGSSVDSLLADATEEGTTYQRLLASLQNSGKAALRKTTFYTLVRSDSGWIFLVDAYEGDDHSALGSSYEIKDPEVQSYLDLALERGSSHDPRLVADEWGVWMSAYARVPGTRLPTLVGVDIPASDLKRNEGRVLAWAILFSLVGALGAALITRQIVHRTLGKALGNAASQVEALQRGDLAPKEVTATGDELEAIGHAINATASHLRTVVGQVQVDWIEVTRRLEESARLALLVENNPSPMAILNPDGTVHHLNGSCRALLESWGQSASLGERANLSNLHPALASLCASQTREFQEKGRIWTFQLQPVTDSTGQSVALQGIFQDITRQRESEQAQIASAQLQESLRRDALEQERLQHEAQLAQSQELSRQIQRLLVHVEALRLGDLTGDSPTLPPGAIAQLSEGLASLVDSLRGQMGELTMRSRELTVHSLSMRDASLVLGTQASQTRTEVAAARTEAAEVQSGLDQAMRTCAELVEDIKHLTRSSQEAVEAASRAGIISSEATRQVSSLEIAGSEIAKVSTLVTDIARQTSLLAINAAVEAAHAGQAGAGFAVVAAEVQALSMRTSVATATIDQSLEDIRNGTRSTTVILSRIEEAVARIHKLQENVDQALLRQKEATGKISRETLQARERARSVDSHLVLVEKAADRTTQAAQQGLLQAQGLSDMSSSINELVARFKT